MTEPQDCYSKALPGEPRFTLIGRDPHAPAVIRHWANLREYEGEIDPKIDGARKIASDMEAYRAELVKADEAAEAQRIADIERTIAVDNSILRRAVNALRGR